MQHIAKAQTKFPSASTSAMIAPRREERLIGIPIVKTVLNNI